MEVARFSGQILGAVAEHYVSIWLLESGWNFSCPRIDTGTDVLAIRGFETRRIQVKGTITDRAWFGSHIPHGPDRPRTFRRIERSECDWFLVVRFVADGRVFLYAIPFEAASSRASQFSLGLGPMTSYIVRAWSSDRVLPLESVCGSWNGQLSPVTYRDETEEGAEATLWASK